MADLSFQDHDGDLSAFALDARRFAATFRDAIWGVFRMYIRVHSPFLQVFR